MPRVSQCRARIRAFGGRPRREQPTLAFGGVSSCLLPVAPGPDRWRQSGTQPVPRIDYGGSPLTSSGLSETPGMSGERVGQPAPPAPGERRIRATLTNHRLL